ncbi:MAG: polyhydroxyalkanoate synthesis regulator DNA-binding domain-containing protein [Acidobacteriota bacterium]
MRRVIKRYDNRKLYDTSAKAYVSLPELAALVRSGDEIEVIDNATGEDLTAQTLTKVILEEGAQAQTWLNPQFLHEMVRAGGKAVDRLWQASRARVAHLNDIRQEVTGLRERLEDLEKQIENLEGHHGNDTA